TNKHRTLPLLQRTFSRAPKYVSPGSGAYNMNFFTFVVASTQRRIGNTRNRLLNIILAAAGLHVLVDTAAVGRFAIQASLDDVVLAHARPQRLLNKFVEQFLRGLSLQLHQPHQRWRQRPARNAEIEYTAIAIGCSFASFLLAVTAIAIGRLVLARGASGLPIWRLS